MSSNNHAFSKLKIFLSYLKKSFHHFFCPEVRKTEGVRPRPCLPAAVPIILLLIRCVDSVRDVTMKNEQELKGGAFGRQGIFD